MKSFSIILAGLVATQICHGQARLQSAHEPPLRQISRDIFQLGAVRLDKTKKTVQFPAFFNLKEGLVEYVLVNSRGKSYESLLRTDVEPYYIHLAMLLIGAKGAPQTPALLNAPTQAFHVNRPAGASNAIPRLAIEGDRVTIEFAWELAGKRNTLRAEDCLMNLATKTNAIRGPWTYNGSRVIDGMFIAQREGSIIAAIDDLDAMINNPRPGSENDQIWEIRSNAIPGTNTPVEVTFKLETSANK